MNLKSKLFKESHNEEYLCESVEIIKEVVKKNNCKMQYKFKKNVLKLKNNHLSLISKTISKEKVSCNLCLKHIRFTYADLPSKVIDDVDRCRSLEDILGNKLFIRFKSAKCASLWQKEIEKYNDTLNELYRDLDGQILVINEASDILQGNILVDVKGDVKGSEMKAIAEKQFKMDGLLSLKYSLEIQNGRNIISVEDDTPIFCMNEYLTGYSQPLFCSAICKQDCKAPSKPITLLVLDKANEQRKNFIPDKTCKRTIIGPTVMYNIDQRWHNNLMPTWLLRLLADIFFYGIECKGIFRMSTPKLFCRSYYELMLTRDDFNIEPNMFLKANVLKQFLAKIDGGLLNFVDKNFININLSNIKTSEKFLRDRKKENALLKILSSLSQQRFLLLQYLLVVFKSISLSDKTYMDAYNIGAMCAPSIFNNFAYNIVEYSDEAMKLSMLVECIILLFEKIVDNPMHQSIQDTLSKYKSDSCTILFEDSQTNSMISESCFSANSLSTPEKSHTCSFKESKREQELSNERDKDNVSYTQPESCLNENETILSPRTRVYMGTKLLEKFSGSPSTLLQNETTEVVDTFSSPNKKVLKERLSEVKCELSSELFHRSQIERPSFSTVVTRQRRKLPKPSLSNPNRKSGKMNSVSSLKENVAPLVKEENADSIRSEWKPVILRMATRHSSLLERTSENVPDRRQRKKVRRQVSMKISKEDVPSTSSLPPTILSLDTKQSNNLSTVEENIRLVSEPSKISTRYSSMLETTNIGVTCLRQRKKQSRPHSTLTQGKNNNRQCDNDPEESWRSNRSRSPYVKNMVEMYETRLRSYSTNVEDNREGRKIMKTEPEKSYQIPKPN